MKERTLIVAGIAGLLLITGCGSPETRYKVLSFFFDGVPDPQEEKAGLNAGRNAGTSTAKPVQRYGEHGPYAARMCDGCHQQGTNKLILPREELCFSCHVFTFENKKIHGPLASGGCTVCHEPHGSQNRFLLVSDPKEFCLYCHDKNAILKTEAHQGADLQCTECHDAHSSTNEFLLK